jgi:predicted XRE-type DNA-binding protein
MRGKIDLFSIDTLVNMIGAAGLHMEMQIGKAA